MMPFGLFEYLFTPFGLSNAAQTFQRMMDRTTDSLEGVFAHMDVSRVGSPDRQTHLCRPDVFQCFSHQWSRHLLGKMRFLGHTILAMGAATADHATEIKDCPPPQDIKQLQHFFGMVNFDRCFLPNCNQILEPLTDLLKGGAKILEWTAPHRRPSTTQNASCRRRCHSNTLPPLLSFFSPLTPPILISEGSCSKNLETIGGHLDSFPTN
jgi:hypothetical protein